MEISPFSSKGNAKLKVTVKYNKLTGSYIPLVKSVKVSENLEILRNYARI